MIIFTLLKASFYLLLVMVVWVLFALFWGNLGTLINKWKQADLDIKIVSFFPPILFIALLIAFDLYDPTERGYVSLITLMIQLSAITLASVAAVIAFRNYRRKSGDGLFYAMGSNRPYIPVVILYNIKDKQAFILAIDVVLSNGTRIRMVDFLLSEEPFSLAAFETKMLKLGKVFKYNDQAAAGFSFKNIKEFICITPNGETIAKRLILPVMTHKYVKENNILRALRVRNKPPKYGTRALDLDAKYWVYISENVQNRYEQYSSIHTLTGFIVGNKFYLTNESLNYLENERSGIKAYCLNTFHKKEVVGSYKEKSIRHEDGSYLINGLFWQEDWTIEAGVNSEFDICVLDKIEKIKMDNKPQ